MSAVSVFFGETNSPGFPGSRGRAVGRCGAVPAEGERGLGGVRSAVAMRRRSDLLEARDEGAHPPLALFLRVRELLVRGGGGGGAGVCVCWCGECG